MNIPPSFEGDRKNEVCTAQGFYELKQSQELGFKDSQKL